MTRYLWEWTGQRGWVEEQKEKDERRVRWTKKRRTRKRDRPRCTPSRIRFRYFYVVKLSDVHFNTPPPPIFSTLENFTENPLKMFEL